MGIVSPFRVCVAFVYPAALLLPCSCLNSHPFLFSPFSRSFPSPEFRHFPFFCGGTVFLFTRCFGHLPCCFQTFVDRRAQNEPPKPRNLTNTSTLAKKVPHGDRQCARPQNRSIGLHHGNNDHPDSWWHTLHRLKDLLPVVSTGTRKTPNERVRHKSIENLCCNTSPELVAITRWPSTRPYKHTSKDRDDREQARVDVLTLSIWRLRRRRKGGTSSLHL